DPLAIVYSLLPAEHMNRAAGRAPWDEHGPHYEVVDGFLKYMGPFGPSPLWTRMLVQSRVYSALLNARHFATGYDRERLLAILLKARDLSRGRYHAPFFIVLWSGSFYFSEDNANEKWIAERLEQNGVPTLQLLSTVSALKSFGFRFPIDRHPTAHAYALVANALKTFLDPNLLASECRTPPGCSAAKIPSDRL